MKRILSFVLIGLLLSVSLSFGGEVCAQHYTSTLPYVTTGNGWWTGIAVQNTALVKGCLSVRYPNTAWKCYSIVSNGVTTVMLTPPEQGATYVDLRASSPLTVFECISNGYISFDYVTTLLPPPVVVE